MATVIKSDQSLEEQRLLDEAFPRLVGVLQGYQVARAVIAADELGLVEYMRDAPKSAQELAEATQMHEPSMRRLMRALTSVELFKEDPDGRYALGPLAPALRNATDALIGIESYRAWGDLLYSVRTGEATFEPMVGQHFYQWVAEDAARAQRFNDAMATTARSWIAAVMDAYDFSDIGTVCDVGGGTGTFITTVLQAHPSMQGILLDQPHVIANAHAVIEKAGVADRCEAVPGSYFEPMPTGADAYSLCNVLNGHSDDEAVGIVARCRQALDQRGRLLIIDRLVPSSESAFHKDMAFLDLFFLVLVGARIPTAEEYESLLEQGGFKLSRVVPTKTEFCIVEGIPA